MWKIQWFFHVFVWNIFTHKFSCLTIFNLFKSFHFSISKNIEKPLQILNCQLLHFACYFLMSFISKINYLVCTNQSVWISLVGMKTRLYLKHFSKTGISSQFDSEILSYKSTIYLLEQCLRENIVCRRLLPLLWSTDCDPKQKTFMNTMLADREKVPLPGPYSRLPPQHQVSAFRWILALDRHWRLSRKRKATLVIV